MTSHTKPETSGDEDKLLQYLALLIEILRRQSPDDEAKKRKVWWHYFVEPAVLTALVTVIFGGILGGIITANYQDKLKEREAQQAMLRARGDQSLLWYKEYLSQEQEVVRRVYGLIGNCVSASERLISQTGPAFRQDFSGRDKESVESQQNNIKHEFNEAKAKWQSGRVELSFLLSYYFHGQAEVNTTWPKVGESLDSYLSCAERWNNDHQPNAAAPTEEEVKNACKNLYAEFTQNLNEMTGRLEASSQYPWKQMEVK